MVKDSNLSRMPDFLRGRVPASIAVITSLGLSATGPVLRADTAIAQDQATPEITCPAGQHAVTTQDIESIITTCKSDLGEDEIPVDNSPSEPVHKPKPVRKGVRDFYVNPMVDVMKNGSIVAQRIDMGVDYLGHGNIRALGEGVVTVSKKGTSNYWGKYGGNAVVYRLTAGPAKGNSVFVSEHCTPKVKVKDKVTPGEAICYMYGGIETGWAKKRGPHKDWPAAHEIYHQHPNGTKTAYGLNFSRLLRVLGAPAGNSNSKYKSSNSGQAVGTLPASLKPWHKY